jgi:hypothetical protein
VTVTVKVPLADGVHDRVEVPEPVTLVGVRVQDRPVAGETAAVRLTTPANPLTAVTVIVEVPAVPTVVVTVVGLAAIVKSWTTKDTVAVWVRLPLVPVTVTVYVCAVAEEHESVEVWLAPRTMLAGVRVHVRPVGETEDVRATVPVNPLTGATVIVDVPAAFALTVTLVGLAVTVKSVIV